jgi:uncharacterized membrane protein
MLPGMGATVTNTPKEILASEKGVIIVNITIKSGEGALVAGQVLGIETATEKYVKYDDTAIDGSEVAQAILGDAIDTSSSDQLVSAYIRGAFKKDQLVGYDAAALVDLNGRAIGKVGGATTDIILI